MLKHWKLKIRKFKNRKAIEKQHFNASVQANLLTRSQRLIDRIETYRRGIKKQNSLIDVKDFDNFVKSIEIMIRSELSIRGNTRDNKIIYLYSGKAKDFSTDKWQII